MTDMRRPPFRAIAAPLCACLATLLGACGSQTKTVTVSNVPPAPQGTTAKSQAPNTASTATTPTHTPSTSTATTPTRSAPEPAFTQKEANAEGSSAAAAVVRAHGFTPNSASDYHEGQALRVLVGTRTGSGDGYGQQAFFFVNGRYIGTDTKQPSATLKIVAQSDTEVTLGYPLYRKSDPLSSPSGGEARVTFQLNNGKLVPLGKIPPAESSSGYSRQ